MDFVGMCAFGAFDYEYICNDEDEIVVKYVLTDLEPKTLRRKR